MNIKDHIVAVRYTANGTEVTLKGFYNQHGPINGYRPIKSYTARFAHRLPNGENLVVDARVRPGFEFDYSDVGKDGDLVILVNAPLYVLQYQDATVREKDDMLSVVLGRPVFEHRLDVKAELVSFNGHKVISKY